MITKHKKRKLQQRVEPLSFVLIGIVLFLFYHMINNNKSEIIMYQPTMYQPTIYETDSDDDDDDDDDDDEPYREDIYKPDIKRINNTKPFNYPTRGPPQEYNMVGFLQDPNNESKLQQLYGRRTYPNSNNWNYFVKSDQYHQIPIPVSMEGHNCTDERGCKEVTNQDTINLFDKEHTATIYKPEPYYYNPHVI